MTDAFRDEIASSGPWAVCNLSILIEINKRNSQYNRKYRLKNNNVNRYFLYVQYHLLLLVDYSYSQKWIKAFNRAILTAMSSPAGAADQCSSRNCTDPGLQDKMEMEKAWEHTWVGNTHLSPVSSQREKVRPRHINLPENAKVTARCVSRSAGCRQVIASASNTHTCAANG